ncbi:MULTISPECIES: DUF3896 family protein [Bacillaceae]|uniref:DUF3896 family protein n=1 Tax=Bacillaceae TaxID=186817 RepID=UPI000BA5C8A6|nr:MULTISPECIES: DUF3896 family protein [Bacillaceae]PAE23772.1 hypothetical protein CHI10_16260 [Bacillus sp. 7894-2]URM34685.1 DUF3896 domain-containing protein [Cytobacillus firmus]
MNYLEIKKKLEAAKQELEIKMQNQAASESEKETLQKRIENYEYMIELTDMNHFERGNIIS